MNEKPHPFNGKEGVVGLRGWIEKIEQVFEISKCAEGDNVMFAASTFEGRALTWWNRNVHTLGLANANNIPWKEFKTMMTGDDIEAYNNRFHELALMCPDLVPTEKKKVERMNTTSRENASKSDDRIDKLADQISTLVDIFAKKIVTPASVKAVKESCVTCSGNHAYYNCPNTDSNQPSVFVATGTYNQVAPQNRASNFMPPPGFAPVQNGQNSINLTQQHLSSFNNTIQHHQLLLGSTEFFTSSIKHLVFFFKIYGSINSKANSFSKKSSEKFLGFDVENLSLTKFHNASKSSLLKFFSKVRKLINNWSVPSVVPWLAPLIVQIWTRSGFDGDRRALGERRKKICNEDLCTELDYFSEEKEMKSRPVPIRKTIPVPRIGSSRARRQRKRVVKFKYAPNRDGGKVERNYEGRRPSKYRANDNKSQGVNLPPLLAAHLGRSENGQPLQSSLTFVHRGRQPSVNIGGNLPPNDMNPSHNAQPFIPNNYNHPMGLYILM
nr:hypothetical protein [Tanacetum cinerariifolium]